MAKTANDQTQARFITLEGGEGSGKSTQIKLLSEKLKLNKISHITTREPGGAPESEIIRDLLLSGSTGRWDGVTELLLMSAARREHCRKTIWPALENSQWVLCDRFADSTMAYQGYAHGVGRTSVEQVMAVTLHQFQPDLTIVLDIPADVGLARAKSRGAQTRIDKMDSEFHQAVRDGYLDIARREPSRCVVIDASGSIESIAETIWQVITSRFAVT
jgi:dTMP kinase